MSEQDFNDIFQRLFTFVSWEARHDKDIPYGLAMAKIKLFLENQGVDVKQVVDNQRVRE